MSVHLSELINETSIILQLQGNDRDSIFREMVDHMARHQNLPPDLVEPVIEGLFVREAKMSTAIGHGLALPHTSVAGLPKPLALLGRHSGGVDCQALDDQPVYIFFMIIVPADQYATHLRTLATASKFFNQSAIREKIASAQSVIEVLDLVKEF